MSSARKTGMSIALLASLGMVGVPASAGITVTDSSDPTTLVKALLGPSVSIVGTPTLFGQTDAEGSQQGLYQATDGLIGPGFTNGLLLTSGLARNVIGPNKSHSTSKDWSSVLPGNAGNDADLSALATSLDSSGSPVTTFDKNVLEFDFTVKPNTQDLGFHYVFGSEEYLDFVKSSVNDVFGFYVDGKNVAIVPGTNDPVTVDSINLTNNSSFFRNNSLGVAGGDSDPATSSPIDTELDGLTTPLFANVGAALDPTRQVHHIKLAIADAGDSVYDSAVFLQGNSFNNGGTPPVSGPPSAAVPEPSSLALLSLGLSGLTFIARKRRRA